MKDDNDNATRDILKDNPVVLIEIPECWFAPFYLWFTSVRISDVPRENIVAVHRVYRMFNESYEEFYNE